MIRRIADFFSALTADRATGTPRLEHHLKARRQDRQVKMK